jgi:hypothetical protein
MKQGLLIWLIVPMLIFSSCSDAEIVAGTYHGKIYFTDTLDANVKITKINDGIIRLDLTGPTINGGYVEYAQLTKNANDAYNFHWTNTTMSSTELSGYYYEGYLNFDSWTHQYNFNGNRE